MADPPLRPLPFGPPTSRDMISGPDLGGGLLHQLTRDRYPDRVRFTYHAQAGGEDAGGPPKGALEPLGWAFPPEMCQFGGRRCWERSFELPDPETANVRAAYQRMRFVLAALLDQQYAAAEVPWEGALGEVIDRLGGRTADWALTGSVARRVIDGRGAVDRISIRTSAEGVRSTAEALREYLIEPAAPTVWSGRPLLAARAFVGSPSTGVRVEWHAADASPASARSVAWAGRRMWVELPQ